MGIHFYRSKSRNYAMFHLISKLYEYIEPVIDVLEKKTGLSLDLYGDTNLTDENVALLLNLIRESIRSGETESNESVRGFIIFLESVVREKISVDAIGD